LAVTKVLEEMKKAEEFAMKWNVSWSEQLLDAYCLPFYYTMGERDVRDIERKYGDRYLLSSACYSPQSKGVPLVKEKLVGNNTLTGEKDKVFECEFGTVIWYNMESHKASRYFSFKNNGDIIFKKESKYKNTTKPSKQISYNAYYNVLSPSRVDIFIDVKIDKTICDRFLISLAYNILTVQYNNIKLIYNVDVDGITCYENNLEIQEIETKVVEILKSIRSELPLPGLVERINNVISLLDNKKQAKIKLLRINKLNNKR